MVCVGGGEGGKHGVSTYESQGSNPEESFKREVSTYVRQVLAWVKTFFGVGSLVETPVKQPPQVNEHNLFLFELSRKPRLN